MHAGFHINAKQPHVQKAHMLQYHETPQGSDACLLKIHQGNKKPQWTSGKVKRNQLHINGGGNELA